MMIYVHKAINNNYYKTTTVKLVNIEIMWYLLVQVVCEWIPESNNNYVIVVNGHCMIWLWDSYFINCGDLERICQLMWIEILCS